MTLEKPKMDPAFLLAHVEYSIWARRRILSLLQRLTEEEKVVTLARQAGAEPNPDEATDLIFFYLDRFPQSDQKDWNSRFGMKG